VGFFLLGTLYLQYYVLDTLLSLLETIAHNANRSASQGKLNTARIPQGQNVPSTKASKSGRIPDVSLIKTMVNGGTDGIEQLSGLPIEGGGILINMGISTVIIFLATEVGDLAKKYQVWHKQMAKHNPRSSRPVSLITKGSARIYLTKMRKSLRESLKIEK
jgi:hypothetical protein